MKQKINIDAQAISDKAVSEAGQGIPLSGIGGKNSAFCILHSAFLSFSRAFTLVEVMIAVALFGLVMAGTIEVYVMCSKFWHATSLSMETSRMANLAIQRMVSGLESNCSLRSAGTVVLQTNAYGHPYPFLDSYQYWETGNQPPSAINTAYYTHIGCAYGSDGSWRLLISNALAGVQCIDYNSQVRTILFCPDTNQTAAARSKRILICNYVSAATATVKSDSGTVEIELTVWKKDGMFVSSNQASMVVKKRNN